MPLDREHVTLASRVMLRVYPLFAAAIGASLCFTPKQRLLATPSFAYIDGLVSIRAWGVGFFVVAAALVAAWTLRHRAAYQAALSLMLVWMLVFAAATLAAAFGGTASFGAWTWPAFVACACWASLLSLWARER